MKSRPIAAVFFVALCLVLCGLILRRQIAAHPVPLAMEQATGAPPNFSMDLQGWHAAPPAIALLAHNTIQGQLSAFHDNDGAKAMSYQSQSMRHAFQDPQHFEQMINQQYPEFGKYRRAIYGPVWADKSGQHVRAVVMVEGENGRHARGEYLLIQEGGQLKVAGVQTQRLPN